MIVVMNVPQMPQTSEKKPFQILSLDGGGLKGIFASAALAAIERDHKTSLTRHFDLIAGTSTGGLIALAMAAGICPQNVGELYMEHASDLFPRRWRPRILDPSSRYQTGPLREMLESAFGEQRLDDSPVRLAIPAFDLASNDVYLFRTPHASRLRRDHSELLVDVALATTSAPTYFPAHQMRGLRLVDGGVWANNPTMVAVVEALATCGAVADKIRVLNVGTTTEVKQRDRCLDAGGLFSWRKDAVDVVLHGQTLVSTNQAGLLLEHPVVRLDVPVPAGQHRLDNVDAEDLMGKAEAASRHISPKLEKFFTHVAPPYWNYAKGDVR